MTSRRSILGSSLALISLLLAAAAPPLREAQPEPRMKHIAHAGDVRVWLMNVRAETTYDGIGDALQNVLEIQCVVICPAEAEGVAVRPSLNLTTLEDERGNDLLAGLTPRDPARLVYQGHPFAKSSKQRDTEAADPDRTFVFKKSSYFVAIDPPYQPRQLRRIAGTAEVIQPRGIRTFDFDAIPGDAESRVLRELVPGLWMAVSRDRTVSGGWTTTIYCWQCNSVGPEFEGRPERSSAEHFEAVPLPRARRDEVSVGHDLAAPPAVVGIWEIDEEAKPLEPATFELPLLAKRASGIYTKAQYDQPAQPGLTPRRVRVAVATEFNRQQVPFEFRDVPLATRLPDEAPNNDP